MDIQKGGCVFKGYPWRFDSDLLSRNLERKRQPEVHWRVQGSCDVSVSILLGSRAEVKRWPCRHVVQVKGSFASQGVTCVAVKHKVSWVTFATLSLPLYQKLTPCKCIWAYSPGNHSAIMIPRKMRQKNSLRRFDWLMSPRISFQLRWNLRSPGPLLHRPNHRLCSGRVGRLKTSNQKIPKSHISCFSVTEVLARSPERNSIIPIEWVSRMICIDCIDKSSQLIKVWHLSATWFLGSFLHACCSSGKTSKIQCFPGYLLGLDAFHFGRAA